LEPITDRLKSIAEASQRNVTQYDHQNLEHIQMSKVLSQWQTTFAKHLSTYRLFVEYLDGRNNIADGPMRIPN